MRKRVAFLFLLLFFLVSFSVAGDKIVPAGPLHNDEKADRWARKTLRKMSLEEKIGQMFMVWARVEFLNVQSPQYIQLHDWMKKYHIGGFGITVPVDGPFLLRNQPYEAAMLTNQLQRDSKLPLIFAADFERGVFMRLNGTTGFPHAMAFGATGNKDDAFVFGKITAEESRAIGVHWNFFPDADVNSEPANPIINTRAFGDNAHDVGEMVRAYIAGAHGAGMMTTAKHFPGHGDTDSDSHLGTARVNATNEHLSQVELPPFRDAIEAGVDSVMVAHVSVPALEPDPNKVASISKSVITGELKQRMGFEGLVITDAMDMQAVVKLFSDGRGNPHARAAVEAVKAGNDMILIPGDIDAAYSGVLNAVRSKEIPESQIDDSVLKILRAKASLGLDKERRVDINALSTLVSTPENLATAQRIADDAVTVVRDNGRVLPLKFSGTAAARVAYNSLEESRNRVLALVLTDDVRTESGRVFERQLRAHIPDARVLFIDARSAEASIPLIEQALPQTQVVLAAVYVTPTAGRAVQVGTAYTGSVGINPALLRLLKDVLLKAPEKTVVLALGNPYVASDFPDVQNYICTFSNAPVSENSAVKALFGEIAIRGHLPVTIPGVARRGDGIERAATIAGGSK